MDFSERIFGLSPDRGDGMFELLLFAIPIAGWVCLWLRRQARHDRREGPR